MQPAMLPMRGYLEDLPHFDMAMELLANLRLEHAREALLQVIENLVNHAIRFNVNVILLGQRAGRPSSGTTWKPMMATRLSVGLALVAIAEFDIAFADRAPRRCERP